MGAALLIGWSPRQAANDVLARRDAALAALPGRLRALPKRHLEEPSIVCSVAHHAASLGNGVARSERHGAWLALVGNPMCPWLERVPANAVPERVLAACLRDGPRALDELSPPFAAAYRAPDGALHVAVDRCGIQQVYRRACADGSVWLCSSSRALRSLGPATPDDEGIAEWLSAGHFFSQRTFTREVGKLPAGARLLLGPGNERQPSGWTPPGWVPPASHAAAHETDYLHRFRHAVEAHAERDSVAVELTGGLDSRLVLAALLSSGSAGFAWTFGQATCDELRTVERLQRRTAFAHVAVELNGQLEEDVAGLVREMHDLGDGEVNALEYAPLLVAFSALEGKRDVSMSGGGGEIGRGFYYGCVESAGSGPARLSLDRLMRKAARTAGPTRHLLRPDRFPDPDAPLRDALGGFVERSPSSSAWGVAEDVYIRARMQRFGGRNHSTTGYFCRQALPYFANDVVDVALALPPSRKARGDVVRNSIRALSPELSRVPLDSGDLVASRNPAVRSARRAYSLARKAGSRYAGPTAKRLLGARFAPVPPVPWDHVRRAPAFRELAGDLLLAEGARIDDYLCAQDARRLVEGSLAGGSMFSLGLLLTLELTLRDLGRSAR